MSIIDDLLENYINAPLDVSRLWGLALGNCDEGLELQAVYRVSIVVLFLVSQI